MAIGLRHSQAVATAGAGVLNAMSRLASMGRRPKNDDSFGQLVMEVTYIPFFRPDFDTEEMEKNPAKVMEMMQVCSLHLALPPAELISK